MTTLFGFFALLLGGVAPEPLTAWMEPARLGVEIGMTCTETLAELERRGRTAVPGKEKGHFLVTLSENRSVTLAFEKDRLQSMRFELSDFIPVVRVALAEVETRLQQRHGDPTRKIERPPALVYDGVEPRIYVVASVEHQGAFGRQGLGFLVVRYFAPPAPAS
ncbi:MAG TPA: hypothetical protein VMS56_10185 [Thermoanaerobaculia bacterium]|nr:hypothetical protein [Thermoanaerobaculia bacterium]